MIKQTTLLFEASWGSNKAARIVFQLVLRQWNEEFLISEVFLSLRDKNAYIRTDFA